MWHISNSGRATTEPATSATNTRYAQQHCKIRIMTCKWICKVLLLLFAVIVAIFLSLVLHTGWRFTFFSRCPSPGPIVLFGAGNFVYFSVYICFMHEKCNTKSTKQNLIAQPCKNGNTNSRRTFLCVCVFGAPFKMAISREVSFLDLDSTDKTILLTWKPCHNFLPHFFDCHTECQA